MNSEVTYQVDDITKAKTIYFTKVDGEETGFAKFSNKYNKIGFTFRNQNGSMLICLVSYNAKGLRLVKGVDVYFLLDNEDVVKINSNCVDSYGSGVSANSYIHSPELIKTLSANNITNLKVANDVFIVDHPDILRDMLAIFLIECKNRNLC
jgi:hypothetical protein